MSTDNSTLAREVYDTLYQGVGSFEGPTGMHVAYLIGGILTESGLHFSASLDDGEEEFHQLLTELFEPDHGVWKWVTVEPADEMMHPTELH